MPFFSAKFLCVKHFSSQVPDMSNDRVTLTDKQKKAQRSRSIALALALAAFVIIVYVGTWAKLGANILIRPM